VLAPDFSSVFKDTDSYSRSFLPIQSVSAYSQSLLPIGKSVHLSPLTYATRNGDATAPDAEGSIFYPMFIPTMKEFQMSNRPQDERLFSIRTENGGLNDAILNAIVYCLLFIVYSSFHLTCRHLHNPHLSSRLVRNS
jgi:hypothetical protein